MGLKMIAMQSLFVCQVAWYISLMVVHPIMIIQTEFMGILVSLWKWIDSSHPPGTIGMIHEFSQTSSNFRPWRMRTMVKTTFFCEVLCEDISLARYFKDNSRLGLTFVYFYLSIYLFIYLSIDRLIDLSIYRSIYLSIYLSVYLSI